MGQLHPRGLFDTKVAQEELEAVMAVGEVQGLALVGDMVQQGGIIVHLAEIEVGPLVHFGGELGPVKQVKPVAGLLLLRQKLRSTIVSIRRK